MDPVFIGVEDRVYVKLYNSIGIVVGIDYYDNDPQYDVYIVRLEATGEVLTLTIGDIFKI